MLKRSLLQDPWTLTLNEFGKTLKLMAKEKIKLKSLNNPYILTYRHRQNYKDGSFFTNYQSFSETMCEATKSTRMKTVVKI